MSQNGQKKSVKTQKSKNQRHQPKSNQENRARREADFELLKLIGQGGYGKVYQVREKRTDNMFAMKVLLKKEICREEIVVRNTLTEREVLTSHSSPHLCSLKYAFQSDSKLFLVMPYFPGGDLYFLIGRKGSFSERDAKFYLAQVVLGVEKLHEMLVMHRDIKPDNILLDHRGHCKLADFGLAKKGIPRGQKTRTNCGTPLYMAPEVIRKLAYSYEVDWWAVGIVLYELLVGYPPFVGANGNETKEMILVEKLSMPSYISPSARNLLSCLLTRNVNYRISGVGVKSHRFFEKFDWKATHRMTAPFLPTLPRQSSTAQNVTPDEADPVGAEYQDVFSGFDYSRRSQTTVKLMMSMNGQNDSVKAQKKRNQQNQENEPNMKRRKNETVESNQENRSMVEGDFELLTVLGEGGYGKVFQVKEKRSAKIFAMKVLIKKNICQHPIKVRHAFMEREVLTSHSSPFLCSLKYAFQSDTKLFLVMPFFAGGDLFSVMKRKDRILEQEAKFYVAQVVLGVEKLHEMGVIYRDLKADNVLLDHRGHCKLADFGFAKRISKGEKTRTFCGTVDYMAPEMIERKGHSYEVDWWAVGILFFTLITGLPPFYVESEDETMDLIRKGNVMYPGHVSPEARQLLTGLLQRNPDNRINGDGIKGHDFFNGFDWNATQNMTAPFVPELTTDCSTAMFDSELTNQEVVHNEAVPVGEKYKYTFSGFEYSS